MHPSSPFLSHDQVVQVAPAPRLARLERADDGVLRGPEMRRGMPQLRAVTAAHVAAREADAQMLPALAVPYAFLADARARRNLADEAQMLAARRPDVRR